MRNTAGVLVSHNRRRRSTTTLTSLMRRRRSMDDVVWEEATAHSKLLSVSQMGLGGVRDRGECLVVERSDGGVLVDHCSHLANTPLLSGGSDHHADVGANTKDIVPQCEKGDSCAVFDNKGVGDGDENTDDPSSSPTHPPLQIIEQLASIDKETNPYSGRGLATQVTVNDTPTKPIVCDIIADLRFGSPEGDSVGGDETKTTPGNYTQSVSVYTPRRRETCFDESSSVLGTSSLLGRMSIPESVDSSITHPSDEHSRSVSSNHSSEPPPPCCTCHDEKTDEV